MRRACPCRFEGDRIRLLGPPSAPEVLLLVEGPEVRHAVVPLPPGRRSRGRLLRYEAAEMLGLPPQEVVHGWRPLGEGRALLVAVARREAEGWWRRLAAAGKRMVGAVSLLDALALAGEGGQGDYMLLFFADEEVHLLHFHRGSYAFCRQMRVSSPEEMLTEVRRSAFFARQQHKAPPGAILLVNPPAWLDEPVRERLRAELGLSVRDRPLEGDDPRLALLQGLRPRWEQLVTLLPPGLARELLWERWNRRLVLPLSAALAACLCWGAYGWQCLRWERVTLEAARRRHHLLGLLQGRHRDSLERLRSLRRELRAVREQLSRRTMAHLYLAFLPRLLPEGTYLVGLRLEAKGEPRCVLQLQVEGDDPERGCRLLSGLVERMRALPFVQEVGLEAPEFVTTGRATLRLRLRRIDASEDLALG